MKESDLMISQKILNTMTGKENGVFKRHEIIEMVITKYPGTNETSVIPSDYCYNIINNGITFDRDSRMFELVKRGVYKYLGTGVNYNGIVTWKGNDYGVWENGEFRKL